MVSDDLFQLERSPLRKLALGLTIPCAILPILMSVYGLINLPFAPLLFRYDYFLFGGVICFYISGLIISYRLHKNLLPLLFFIVSIGSVCFFLLIKQIDLLVLVAIISILLSSLTNQYFRTGSSDCTVCASIQ